MQQANLPEKVFAFERIRLVRRTETTAYAGGARVGAVEYRIGYYAVSRKARRWARAVRGPA